MPTRQGWSLMINPAMALRQSAPDISRIALSCTVTNRGPDDTYNGLGE